MMRHLTILLVAALTCFGIACNKKESDPQGGAQAVATEPKPKEPEPDCPHIFIEDKKTFLCNVTYTSIKDYSLDGKDAFGKRAKLKCRYERIMNGEVWCRAANTKYVFIKINSENKAKIKALKKGKRYIVDGAISDVGAIGPRMIVFNIEPAG